MGGMSGPDSPTGGGAGDLRTAKSRLGQAYDMVPQEYGERSLFGGSDTEATLREVQVMAWSAAHPLCTPASLKMSPPAVCCDTGTSPC